ncbi:MAG: hypothetical protein KC417_06295 [Myxococcales bacterium]|nr:hypothetical protein [Myxococcales bacterium]
MSQSFAIVGGGSAYAPGLLSALLHHQPELQLREVRLFDIDQAHLEIVAALGASMARVTEGGFEVRAVSSLRAAVEGIDVVLNSARPGGFESRRIDETLPLEFGIPGQETVGPGGFFFALRSVPEALAVERAMAAHAPNAVLLNYTNPTNIVTQALLDHGTGQVRVIGLCDQSDEDMEAIASSAGIAHANVAFDCVGLNHGTWYSNVRADGVELLPRAKPEAPPTEMDLEHRERFRLSGVLASEAPGHWPNSYVPYYTHPDVFVRLSKEHGVRTDAIVPKLPAYFEHFREEAAKDVPNLQRHRGSTGFGDLAVRTLRALGADKPRRLVLNAPNGTATDAFRPDTVIETSFDVSGSGQHPLPAPALPPIAANLLAGLEAYQRATAEAAARADGSLHVDALAANPLVRTRERAEAMLEAAKRQYGDRIPGLG